MMHPRVWMIRFIQLRMNVSMVVVGLWSRKARAGATTHSSRTVPGPLLICFSEIKTDPRTTYHPPRTGFFRREKMRAVRCLSCDTCGTSCPVPYSPVGAVTGVEGRLTLMTRVLSHQTGSKLVHTPCKIDCVTAAKTSMGPKPIACLLFGADPRVVAPETPSLVRASGAAIVRLSLALRAP
jgi:ferredoxin